MLQRGEGGRGLRRQSEEEKGGEEAEKGLRQGRFQGVCGEGRITDVRVQA